MPVWLGSPFGSFVVARRHRLLSGGQTFNVMDYGAVHNGTVGTANGTDDSPAVFRAMLDCYLHGGGIVYMPAGVYRLDQGYDLPGGYYDQPTDTVHYLGVDPSYDAARGYANIQSHWGSYQQSIKANIPVFNYCTLVGAGAGQTILNNTNGDSRNTTGAVYQHNISIHDLTVTSPSAAVSKASNKDAYKYMGCSDSSVYNTVATNFSIGLNYSGCTNCTFTNMIHSTMGRCFSGSTACDAASAGGAYYMDVDNVTFTDCEASASDASGAGFGFMLSMYSAEEIAAGTVINNVTFNNCSSHDNVIGGFYLNHTDQATILNSDASNNGESGYRFDNSTGYWCPVSPTANFNTGTGNPTLLASNNSSARGIL